jgi:HAD superfamily hydrolase (TIGR01490 family)
MQPEIVESRPSLRSAAIFDLDGTLIPNASAERTFFFHLIRHRGLSLADLLQMARPLLLAKGNLHQMTYENKHYLRGKSAEKIELIARAYFEPQVKSLLFPRMKEIIERHRAAGDQLLLLTGTLDFIATCFVRALGMDGFRATNLEVADGRFTGMIHGIAPYGMGKLEVLREMRRKFHFDLNQTTLYANLFADRYVLNAVEEPVAVNPDKNLRRYALRHGWRIIEIKTLPLLPPG